MTPSTQKEIVPEPGRMRRAPRSRRGAGRRRTSVPRRSRHHGVVVGSALIGVALAVAAAASIRSAALVAEPHASVDVSTHDFRVVPADRAFDGFIAEASALYG